MTEQQALLTGYSGGAYEPPVLTADQFGYYLGLISATWPDAIPDWYFGLRRQGALPAASAAIMLRTAFILVERTLDLAVPVTGVSDTRTLKSPDRRTLMCHR